MIRRDMGPVSFWDSDWVRENLIQEGPHLDDVTSELKVTGGIFSPGNLPSGRDGRLARVDLGTGTWTDPVRAAGTRPRQSSHWPAFTSATRGGAR
jgi:hypothetical protein